MSEIRRIQTGLIYSALLAMFTLLGLTWLDRLTLQSSFFAVLGSILTYFLWYAFYPLFAKEKKIEQIK